MDECMTCGGDGEIPCDECEGDGCDACGLVGSVECPDPDCTA